MAFQVGELSFELVEQLVPLMPRIKQRDKALEDQLRRAASSISLNIGEAEFSDPGNYGGGERGRDAQCAAACGGLADCFGGGGGAGERAVEADLGDPLEDDAGVRVFKRAPVDVLAFAAA